MCAESLGEHNQFPNRVSAGDWLLLAGDVYKNSSSALQESSHSYIRIVYVTQERIRRDVHNLMMGWPTYIRLVYMQREVGRTFHFYSSIALIIVVVVVVVDDDDDGAHSSLI